MGPMAGIVWEGRPLLLYFGFSKHQQHWDPIGQRSLLANAAAALCKRMTGCSDLTTDVFL
ncbi:hypothetical protein EHI43_20055 [Rhizobium leguminosarum]|jgi:hypothetical protein|nr:hypothetical protein EHI43_20055 [Rhizobium leguminosarum]